MIRVLIVDDSRVQRKALIGYLESLPGFKVVGEAIDGLEGVQQAHALKPDVILMDVKMPRLDGLEATRRIMADIPIPILLMTTAENISLEVDLGLRALECGALDLVSKPDLEALKGPDTIIANRLQLLSGIPVIRHPAGRDPERWEKESSRKSTGYFRRAKRVVAIVASTGGPKALTTLLSGLPGNLKAAVVVVQHIDSAFEQGLVRWLDEHSELDVVLACDELELFEGRVYVAPQGHQTELGERRRIRLVEESHTLPGRHCPSGDRLLSSAAGTYGLKAIGCVLTGIGRDGADGLLAVRDAGGITIAQDEATSVVYGMPRAAARNGGAQQILPLEEIAAFISEALR